MRNIKEDLERLKDLMTMTRVCVRLSSADSDRMRHVVLLRQECVKLHFEWLASNELLDLRLLCIDTILAVVRSQSNWDVFVQDLIALEERVSNTIEDTLE